MKYVSHFQQLFKSQSVSHMLGSTFYHPVCCTNQWTQHGRKMFKNSVSEIKFGTNLRGKT